MSLLDNLPHRATILREVRTQDALGGETRTWAVVARDVPCWVQRIGAREQERFDARGVKVDKSVYFRVDPGLAENQLLRIVDPQTAQTMHLEVRAMIDAGVHLGGPFRATTVFYTGDVDVPEEI